MWWSILSGAQATHIFDIELPDVKVGKWENGNGSDLESVCLVDSSHAIRPVHLTFALLQD